MNLKKTAIIYNPMSGRPGRRAEHVRRMVQLLDERGIAATACATSGPDDATRLAREAVASGSGTVISYGGDGTLNEVIQGLAETQTALGIWPGGTSNVVARDLMMPFGTVELANVFAARNTQRIALGLVVKGSGFSGPRSARRGSEAAFQSSQAVVGSTKANLQASTTNSLSESVNSGSRTLDTELEVENAESHATGRYFVMMAGIGLDASIARGVNKKLKRRTGELAYWLSGIKHLFTWRGEPFTIGIDGHEYESSFALIGNGKGYGGGMVITPAAKLEDPWFEVYVLPPLPHKLAYVRALYACMRGRPETSGALFMRAKRVTAHSALEPWVEADGELIGPLPMTFNIVPDALSVIVP